MSVVQECFSDFFPLLFTFLEQKEVQNNKNKGKVVAIVIIILLVFSNPCYCFCQRFRTRKGRKIHQPGCLGLGFYFIKVYPKKLIS